jgi:hypothetical protein
MAKKANVNDDYKDWLMSTSGASEEDMDTVVGTAGNLKDIYDTSIGRLIKGYKKGKSTKSIIGMAAKNTFDFPVFVSKSVPLDYATATVQLLEQMYASYVQMAISQHPIVDASSVKHGGFLANFQTNVTKYVEYADSDFQVEACHNEFVQEGVHFEFDMINCSDVDAQEILECMDYEPLSEFDHFFQEFGAGYHRPRRTPHPRPHFRLGTPADVEKMNQTVERNDHGDITTTNSARQAKDIESELNIEDTDRRGRRIYIDNRGERHVNPAEDEYSQHRREVYRKRQKTLNDAKKSDADAQLASKNNQNWSKVEKDRREEHRLKMMNRAPEVLKEDDMRKMNSMKPLLMKIQLRVETKDGGIMEKPVEFVVGVHCHTRLVDSDTWPDVAKYPLKEMNEIIRHVKWKAGELKFVNDILFQIKEKKQTAFDRKDPKRRWYRRLYEISHAKGDANVAGRISGNGTTGLIPNATIMMTNGDVENVKAQTKLDLMKPSLAKRLCKELFLISLVVIDQDAESIKLFIPDLYGDWDVHSLAGVEKQLAELSTAGSKTRDLFKMLK